MGLDDPVIDVAITPNRGDCLGVYGIARDLAAAGMGRLKPLKADASVAEVMEKIDLANITSKDVLKLIEALVGEGMRGEQAVIAAAAEGYSFPTNLDNDPPLGGLAPKPQAALVHEALVARWFDDAFAPARAEAVAA